MKRPTHPNRPGSSKSALGRARAGSVRRPTAVTLLTLVGLAVLTGLAGCGEDGDDTAGACGTPTAAEDATEIFIEDFVDGEPGTWRLVEVEVGSSLSDGTPTAMTGQATLSSRADLENPDVHMQMSCADLGDLAPDDVMTLSIGAGMDVDRKTGQQSSKLALEWQQSGEGTPRFSFHVQPTTEILMPKPVNADDWSISRLPDGRVEIYFTRTDSGSGMTIAGRTVYALVE